MFYVMQQHEDNKFQDELCDQYIEKITHLQRLIALEEEKLFAAIKLASTHGAKPRY